MCVLGLMTISDLGNAGRVVKRVLLVGAAFTVGAVACTIERGDVRTPSGVPPEADTLRVLRALDVISVAFETGDLAPLDTLYHEAATVYDGGRSYVGWPEYREDYFAPFMRRLTERRLRFNEVMVRLAGTTAWVTCRYAKDARREGRPYSESGVGTLVFQKLAGRWRLVHWHTSARRTLEDSG